MLGKSPTACATAGACLATPGRHLTRLGWGAEKEEPEFGLSGGAGDPGAPVGTVNHYLGLGRGARPSAGLGGGGSTLRGRGAQERPSPGLAPRVVYPPLTGFYRRGR